MKSRQAPLADLESAHQTSIACHLANIAMRTGRVIQWDPPAQRHRGRSGGLGAADQGVPRALGPAAARARWGRHDVRPTRREFLSVVAVGRRTAARPPGRHVQDPYVPCLHVVCRPHAAGTRHPEEHRRRAAGRGAARSDRAVLGRRRPDRPVAAGVARPCLPGARARRAEKAGLWLELSVPSKYLESADAYAQMAGIAQALGVDRIRVALLYGRRYESFATRGRLGRARLEVAEPAGRDQAGGRAATRFTVGIENHKDYTAGELAGLLTSLGQRRRSARASTSATTSRCSRTRSTRSARWRRLP